MRTQSPSSVCSQRSGSCGPPNSLMTEPSVPRRWGNVGHQNSHGFPVKITVPLGESRPTDSQPRARPFESGEAQAQVDETAPSEPGARRFTRHAFCSVAEGGKVKKGSSFMAWALGVARLKVLTFRASVQTLLPTVGVFVWQVRHVPGNRKRKSIQ